MNRRILSSILMVTGLGLVAVGLSYSSVLSRRPAELRTPTEVDIGKIGLNTTVTQPVLVENGLAESVRLVGYFAPCSPKICGSSEKVVAPQELASGATVSLPFEFTGFEVGTHEVTLWLYFDVGNRLVTRTCQVRGTVTENTKK